MTKTREEMALLAESGRLLASVFGRIDALNLKGMSTLEVNDLVERFIVDNLAARPASKGQYGFAYVLNASRNDVVCHGVPSPTDWLTSGDIVNFDITLEKNGFIADIFVLVANPNAQAATVEARFLLTNGTVYTKSYPVAGNSRFNIWVDLEEIPAGSGQFPLANAEVSTTITSTNGVPIIVERAMWWPGGPSTWYEAHNSPAATSTGTLWALADGETGGASSVETYVLIANTSAFAGTARVKLVFDDGTTVSRDFALLANSRFNVAAGAEFPESAGRRFGTLVESLGATPAQLVVERAMYSNAEGTWWAAGTNALATKLR